MAKRVPPLSAATLTKFKPDPVKVLELVDGAVPGPQSSHYACRNTQLVAQHTRAGQDAPL